MPMARDWTEVVPSHDEASFRRCLAESRSRGGVVAGRRGFYLQRGGDIDWEAEEAEREKERRRAAAGLEVSECRVMIGWGRCCAYSLFSPTLGAQLLIQFCVWVKDVLCCFL